MYCGFFSIATVFAIVCTIPSFAIQIWLFVKPGLHPNEQKMTIMYIPVLSILFLAGLCFGYFICNAVSISLFNYDR